MMLTKQARRVRLVQRSSLMKYITSGTDDPRSATRGVSSVTRAVHCQTRSQRDMKKKSSAASAASALIVVDAIAA